jgi:hypothetical protein
MGMFDAGPVLLDSAATLFAVLEELAGADALTWRGGIDVWGEENPPRPATWRLQLNDAKGNSVSAHVGDYLVLTYGRMLVLDAAEVAG